jgi:hypothetical protein
MATAPAAAPGEGKTPVVCARRQHRHRCGVRAPDIERTDVGTGRYGRPVAPDTPTRPRDPRTAPLPLPPGAWAVPVCVSVGVMYVVLHFRR